MQRPTGVTILGVLAYIGAVCLLIGGAVSFIAGSFLTQIIHMPGSGLAAAAGAIVGVVFIMFAVLYGVTGYGLMALKNWGRIIAIMLMILGVVFGIIGLLGSFALFMMSAFVFRIVMLAIDAWILWYLFQPHVKQAFGQAA